MLWKEVVTRIVTTSFDLMVAIVLLPLLNQKTFEERYAFEEVYINMPQLLILQGSAWGYTNLRDLILCKDVAYFILRSMFTCEAIFHTSFAGISYAEGIYHGAVKKQRFFTAPLNVAKSAAT